MTATTTTLSPGVGGDKVLTDTLTTVNGSPAPTDARAQVVKFAYGSESAAWMVDTGNPLPVTGSWLTDTELRASALPVSGTFWQAVQPVSGTVTVSNMVGEGLTDAQLRATAVPVTAAYVKLEDSPSANGDAGVVMLMQRRDSDGTAVDADGDYATLKGDEEGRLKVSTKPASYADVTGNVTSATSTIPVNCSRFSNLMIHCAGTFAGANCTFEGSLNSTNGTDGAWFAVQAIRSNANTIETTTGVLGAAPAYAWELSVNALKWFRIRATAWTSGTQVWTMVPGTYATEPIPGAQVSATQPVSGTVTANIGTGSIAAGTNAIGDVGGQIRGNATGAAAPHHIVSAASTNTANIKASAGRVAGWCLANTTASWQYVKLHNTAAAPTAGTGIVQTIAIPPNAVNIMAVGNVGIGFSTGIGRSVVTGSADADATATTAGAVVGDIFFA